MVKAVFDELAQPQPTQPLHRRHRRRRDPHLAAARPRLRHRARRRRARRVLRPRRRRHRRRQQELDQDHRRGDRQLRPGLLRLRLEEVRRDHRSRTCASARGPIRSLVPDHAGQLRRLPPVRASSSSYDVLEHAAPGGTFLLNAPYGPDEVWDQLPREVQEQHHREEAPVLRDRRRTRSRDETGMGGRINTIMQTCFFAISGVLPARRGDRAASRRRSRRPTASKGAEVVEQNFAAVDADARAPARGQAARRRVTATRAHAAAGRPPRRPTSSSACTAVMLAGKGDLLPVSAFPVDGTWPTGTAQWEKRNIALEIPVWDAAICIQCNKCALVCPHAAIRAKVYDADGARRRAGDLQVDRRSRAPSFKGMKYTVQVAPEDCTGCSAVRRGLPGQGQGRTRRHKAIDMRRRRRCASRSATNYAFFLALPEVDRDAGQARRQGLAVPRAAVRVLGACAGCGETPVRQAADPALRRPAADRQRHRLLVDLRRQPADDARTPPTATGAARPGPTRCSRTTPSSASASASPSTSTREQARELLHAARAATLGDDLVPRAARRPTQHDEAGIAAQRERVARCKRALGGHRRRRGAAPARHARRLPGQEERLDRRRRRLGLRHRLRRPRPRARHAAATSTCWCSTPRSTRTPAASSRRPRRSAPRPSSPRPARRRRRRTSA